MSLTPAEIDEAASGLFEAEKNRKQIGLLSARHPDFDMDDAYAIQKAFCAHKAADGDPVTGWKIGLTSKAMQSALNIGTPDSGMLFRSMDFRNGAEIPADRFIRPRIEAEIAFVMKADVPVDTVCREDIIEATDYVCPSIEILDTRIVRADPETGRTRNVCDTISDNAANAGYILGDEKHAVAAADLRWVGAIVSKDGAVEETGLGAGVLNDPVESVVWLARRMASYGQRIEGGQVILSGSFIRPVECPSGTVIEADFGAFGSVSCRFA